MMLHWRRTLVLFINIEQSPEGATYHNDGQSPSQQSKWWVKMNQEQKVQVRLFFSFTERKE
jgi:hypothetical protein